MIALMRFGLHGDLLLRAPRPYLGQFRLADLLHAGVSILSARCRERPPHRFPLAGLVGETIADLKLRRRTRLVTGAAAPGLLLGPRLAIGIAYLRLAIVREKPIDLESRPA